MPVSFLSPAQRDSYGQYLGDPSTQELARYFLDDSDHTQIVEKRGDANRLGFALQLTTVRFVGTFLDDPTAVPPAVLATMSRQLGIDTTTDLTGYRDGKWRFAHAAQIRTEHGYRDLADRAAGFGLTRWLYAQCWTGTERPSALFDRLGASSGRSETPLTAVANRTFRSIAPQTPSRPTQAHSGRSRKSVDRRLVVRQRPVVEIVQMARHAVVVELDVEHPLRDDTPIAGTGDAGVLQGVLDGEEHTGRRAMVALVDEDRAALQQVAVTFQDQVDDGVEQRMGPGRRQTKAAKLAGPDQPVAVPDQGRNVRHLVAARFTLAGRAAELPERLAEERFDVVRLQAACVGPLHLLAHALHAAGVHRVVDELPLLEQVLQRRPVERLVDGGIEAGAHLRLLAVADGVEQKLAQRPSFELQLAEHVEDLAAERLPGLFQLLEQPPVDVVGGDQVPQVADLRLADAVDAAEALFQAVRVPGQVVVDHQVGALQVDAFAGGVGGQQHLHLRVVPERRQAFLAAHAAMDDDHRRLAAEQGRDALLQVPQRVPVLGEDHQLLMRREQGSEAQPVRPARRLGRGVRPGDLDGAGQAVMPAVRRDADPDEGGNGSGPRSPAETCCSSTATRRK